MRSLVILTTTLLSVSALVAQEYSWQKPHVEVLSNGDMRWQPEPYRYQPGETVRYIDFESGDDDNSGTAPHQAWKRHPWDLHASGRAAQASGPITYVFKGGSIYRGQLEADESGQPGNPIRLVRDPDWGEGPAWFWGSHTLPAQWVRASSVDHPERLPDPAQVWALDLAQTEIELGKDGVSFTRLETLHGKQRRNTKDPTYTGLFLINSSGEFRTLHLARTPDWQPMGDDFAMDFWHTVDAEVGKNNAEGKRIAGGFKDDLWAGKGLPEDYFTGGYIWMGYRSLMGTPTPSLIPAQIKKRRGTVPFFDPADGTLMKWASPYGHGKGGLPYMIENLPQFLDAPGEFYLDFDSKMLYLRLEPGLDPNRQQIEFATDWETIHINDQGHIELAGLGFAFAQGNTIQMRNSVQDVYIHHCTFRNVLDTAINGFQFLRTDGIFSVMDDIRITDCDFAQIGTAAISLIGTDKKWEGREGFEQALRGDLRHVDILRNRTEETGIRHRDSRWGNVSAISVSYMEKGEIAGNLIHRSFGSGLVVFGGKEGNLGSMTMRMYDEPHIRILVHHNKTEDTALGVNDYGGLALWQGGPTYAWSNNIGNSPGHMPAGLFGGTKPLNLSYPLYLDGAFKQYCFNNIIWGRTTDKSDPYANTTPGYFMVFGFLNQFTNNTLYRQAQGIGGSSGNRNDIVSNIFAEISKTFIASNRIGDPSLVGGGDDAGSGLRGVPTLAYSRNIFHGQAKAGYLIREREMERAGLQSMIHAESIAEMAEQMQGFPLRVGALGQAVDELPIRGAPAGPITDLNESVDFAPQPGSAAIDEGGNYFIPWSLYGTVGEWGFAENRADPSLAMDYHFYMDASHFDRMMYEQIPSYDLRFSEVDLDDYESAPSEDWIHSALRLNGRQVGVVTDDFMRQDLLLRIGLADGDVPKEPWQVTETGEEVRRGRYRSDLYELRYPGELRKSLIVSTQNLLIEAIVQPQGPGLIAGKHDGKSGYQLLISESGQAEFRISSNGQTAAVSTGASLTDGGWHHVLAEVDRASSAMTIYLDGEMAGEAQAGLSADASLDTTADFHVGEGLRGAIDFLRVCHGTLADAETDIHELYEWQTNGPFRYDFFGRPAQGRRDAGAIESVE